MQVKNDVNQTMTAVRAVVQQCDNALAQMRQDAKQAGGGGAAAGDGHGGGAASSGEGHGGHGHEDHDKEDRVSNMAQDLAKALGGYNAGDGIHNGIHNTHGICECRGQERLHLPQQLLGRK